MVKLLEGPKKVARTKGTKALAAWVGTGAVATLFGLGIGVTAAAVVGGLGAIVSVLFTYKWLRYRGEWGLKF